MTNSKDKKPLPEDRLIHAYDRMLQRAEHSLDAASRRSEYSLTGVLQAARDKAIELGELTHEEATKVHEFVARDLHDVGRHLAEEERELADWLRLSLLLIEKTLLRRFGTLAEAAKLELRHLDKGRQRVTEWHTGEITSIGTLRCRACGELVHFERTGRIPPCPKCHATVYERVKGK